MFYFAYGSNMSHEQLMRRCPGARFLRPAALTGYGFFFDGYSTQWDGAVANIDSSMDDEVWGGLFEVSEEHLVSLDGYEGYPKFCARKVVDAGDFNAKTRSQAWAYYREAQPTGLPSRRYILTILKGAKDCCLPEEYISKAFGHYMKVYAL